VNEDSEIIKSALERISSILNGGDDSFFRQVNLSRSQILTIESELQEMLKCLGTDIDLLFAGDRMIIDSWADKYERDFAKQLLSIYSKYTKRKGSRKGVINEGR